MTHQETSDLSFTDKFVTRHIGPSDHEVRAMLDTLGFKSLDALISKTVPANILMDRELDLPAPQSELETLRELKAIASKNKPFRSFLGMGYHDCITPPVIQRNILENPGWYTQYTPYQAEIAQGRLEALFNFQTVITELTGLEVANASLLDEATAAAEAMAMAKRANRKNKSDRFFVSELCHPQTIEVIQTRAEPLGIEVVVGDHASFDFTTGVFAALVQYPASRGEVLNYEKFAAAARSHDVTFIVAADLLSLLLLRAPGEFGAEIVVGSSQRFGIPLGFGGPHAGFMSCTQAFRRQIPGRIVGQSIDADGNPALRLALQTREQHIRREKATSNICTAQVLLAIMAGMYVSYHGPKGLRAIANRVHQLSQVLALGLGRLGWKVSSDTFFDTIEVEVGDALGDIRQHALNSQLNFRYLDGSICIALDEATRTQELERIFAVFNHGNAPEFTLEELHKEVVPIAAAHARSGPYLTQECFNSYHSETELLRYIFRLQGRDLSLTTSMIPLGSCTMKLNATSEMIPVTWPEFGGIHPFAPADQTAGYREMFDQLESWLSEITGMSATSLQPNAGSQGEYTGMLVIQAFHKAAGDTQRNICLIPDSAHGTNPASAIMAGMKVVPVRSESNGNIDLDDLLAKAEEHAENLSALMVTYPSTHGVFETEIRQICDIIHNNGGQVYLDGANMNAQVGVCRPGDYGADVCHLNLHKTFCIPHGGGGPGMGPICVRDHLAPFLPGHSVVETGGTQGIGAVSAAPWGSASILPISWAYIRMLGAEGLTRSTQVAILNANYMAKRLEPYFPVLFRGAEGQCAHEFILDMRSFKETSGVQVVDMAKRLMDYGYHAPTISWPVAGTMMIEPTESEGRGELDRFCEALISIRAEIEQIVSGEFSREDNPLVNAPHPAHRLTADEWPHPYSRSAAVFPAPWTENSKFWPAVSRIDDAHGDRNLICSCPPMSAYEDAAE